MASSTRFTRSIDSSSGISDSSVDSSNRARCLNPSDHRRRHDRVGPAVRVRRLPALAQPQEERDRHRPQPRPDAHHLTRPHDTARTARASTTGRTSAPGCRASAPPSRPRTAVPRRPRPRRIVSARTSVAHVDPGRRHRERRGAPGDLDDQLRQDVVARLQQPVPVAHQRPAERQRAGSRASTAAARRPCRRRRPAGASAS